MGVEPGVWAESRVAEAASKTAGVIFVIVDFMVFMVRVSLFMIKICIYTNYLISSINQTLLQFFLTLELK